MMSTYHWVRVVCGCLLALSCSLARAIDADCGGGLAAARDGRPFDAVTGRDPRNFPPDPTVEFKHVKLEMTFDDLASRSFRCAETISFRTLGCAVARLGLDAVELKIAGVTDLSGKPMTYRYDDERLTIRFDPPLPPATDGGVKIEYECSNPKTGMIWAVPDATLKSQALTIHTQGEAEDNRHWFVCHDYPNVRSSTEIIVTIPAEGKRPDGSQAKYVAMANGKLVERKELEGGRLRYHYLQEQPHVMYLVSLVIGDLTIVEDQWRGRPVQYVVPPEQAAHAQRTFGKTTKMLEQFSRLTGFEYPWAKYAQCVVYHFAFGGMENTSTTTLIDNTWLDERAALDQDCEGLISHELAHQWFGDLVTCRSWGHIWLNEGFATFMSHVWQEQERGRDEYLQGIWGTMRGVADSDRVDMARGVVTAYYERPLEVFFRGGSNPYSKGCSALHMLRQSLGDELFWRCIGEYLKRFAFKNAETDDLRKVVDELSGRSYERFFYQWLTRPGVPYLRVGYEWIDSDKEVKLTIDQTQTISEKTPAFSADLAVWLFYDDGTTDKRSVAIDERSREWSVRCAKEPAQVCIDPESALLAKYELNLPVSMLIRSAQEGPTLPVRLSAVRSLADKDRDDVREALQAILLNEQAHYGVRSEAATALGSHQQDKARDMLLAALRTGQELKEHRVRRAAVDAVARYRDPHVAETLLRLARKDATYSVEAAASAGLGGQESSDEIVSVLMENSRKASRSDQIRTAAVDALARLGDPRGIPAARELSSYGQPNRSRPIGIDALAKLGRILARDRAADRSSGAAASGGASATETVDQIRVYLVGLLDDPQDRAVDAAIGALGTFGEREAIGPLTAFANGSAPAEKRDRARQAINSINAGIGESAAIGELRERIKKLEAAQEKMEKAARRGDEAKD